MKGRDPDNPFELDSSDLERLMAALRPTSTAPMMRPRLREFQKRSFPKFANAGRGRRATFTIRETLQVAIAFELVDCELSSTRSVMIVEQNRRWLDSLVVSAWSARRRSEHRDDDEEYFEYERSRHVMLLALSATTRDSGAHVAFGTAAGSAWPIDWPGRRSHISIDVLETVSDVINVLQGNIFRFLPAEVDAAFLEFGNDTFGVANQAEWPTSRLEPQG